MEETKMAAVREVYGFQVLRVRTTAESSASHTLLVKMDSGRFHQHAHRSNVSRRPPGHTLFVVNIPPYCNEKYLRRIFSAWAPVRHVTLQPSPSKRLPKRMGKLFSSGKVERGFWVGYVAFMKPNGPRKALAGIKKAKDIPPVMSGEQQPLVGITKWCKEYTDSIVEEKTLLAEVEGYMAAFEKRKEAEEKEEEGKGKMHEDEDGWVTVTSKARKRVMSRTKAMDTKLKAKERRKRPRKELTNFYQFQMRESKMKELADLRRKFEEDKRRLALMRQTRKFRPF